MKFRGGNGGAYKASAEILQIQGNWLYYILYAEVHLRVKLPSSFKFPSINQLLQFWQNRFRFTSHYRHSRDRASKGEHVRRTVANHSECFSEMLILAEA